jgi:hypothetical protein
MTTFTPDQWIILALVFFLGMLIGIFLTAGGRRKWKTRYGDEVKRREALERQHRDREKHWETREREWREQDSLRASAVRDRSGASRGDVDGDGVHDRADRRPTDDKRA